MWARACLRRWRKTDQAKLERSKTKILLNGLRNPFTLITLGRGWKFARTSRAFLLSQVSGFPPSRLSIDVPAQTRLKHLPPRKKAHIVLQIHMDPTRNV